MVGEPRFILCIDAPVVSPNFATFADPAIIAPKRLLYGFLICGSLNFFHTKNMASVVYKEEAKGSHIATAADACSKTLICINSAKHCGSECATIFHATGTIHAGRNDRFRPNARALQCDVV